MTQKFCVAPTICALVGEESPTKFLANPLSCVVGKQPDACLNKPDIDIGSYLRYSNHDYLPTCLTANNTADKPLIKPLKIAASGSGSINPNSS
ncbi:MAG: hypothetical protein ACK4I8_02595 [Armatimonadota bacterium]